MEAPEVREITTSDGPSQNLDLTITRGRPGFYRMKCSGFAPRHKEPADWIEDNLKHRATVCPLGRARAKGCLTEKYFLTGGVGALNL